MGTKEQNTPFSVIYDSFLNRANSEYYLEMSEIETIDQLQSLLLNAIPRFKLPRFDIFDYEEGSFEYLGKYQGIESSFQNAELTGWIGGSFHSKLSIEEIDILSMGMLIEWFTQQLATTELTKMKFSGSDFKFSSQANHMAKLKLLVETAKAEMKSLQDIYKRRIRHKDKIYSTMGQIMAKPSYGLQRRGRLSYDSKI